MAEHIVSAYDKDLHKLRDLLSQMGGLVETQMQDAVTALIHHDTELATQVRAGDKRIDTLERQVENFAIQILALRQPMAVDLRITVAAIKIAGELERIGDYAKNAAKRTLILAQHPAFASLNGFQRISRMVLENLKNAIDALVFSDAERARQVWVSDQQIDDVYNGIFRELLTHMMEDPRNITVATHLLFIAKNFERAGDHVTNIAEMVHYAVTGTELDTERPKGGLPTPQSVVPG